MLRTLGAIALLLSVAAPALAAETIATLPQESWISSLGDMHLVQIRDEQGYHLMTIEDGELLPLYEIEPSRNPFTADIGTMRHGEPAIVFSRCERGNCDLYLHEIAGAGVRKLRAANTAADERSPTLSAGRVAWVRNRRGRPPVVMIRRLGSRGWSRALRVAPRRPRTWIDGLELKGRWLGVDLGWSEPDEAPHREVRLVSLGGRNRLVDHSVGALSGHDFGGLSFWGDRFGWHRVCWEGECAGEAYRYHLRTGARQVADVPDLAGFALNRGGYVGIPPSEGVGEAPVLRERRVAWRRDRG